MQLHDTATLHVSLASQPCVLKCFRCKKLWYPLLSRRVPKFSSNQISCTWWYLLLPPDDFYGCVLFARPSLFLTTPAFRARAEYSYHSVHTVMHIFINVNWRYITIYLPEDDDDLINEQHKSLLVFATRHCIRSSTLSLSLVGGQPKEGGRKEAATKEGN